MQNDLFRFLSMPLSHARRAIMTGRAPEAVVKGWHKADVRFSMPLFTLPDWLSEAMHPAITASRIAILKRKGIPLTRAVDVTGGIGLTTIILAQAFQKVIVFERDPLRAAFLRKNIQLHGLRNVDVYQMDSTSSEAMSLIHKDDIVFIDPKRPRQAHIRKLDEGEPKNSTFVKRARIVIEDVSPLIPYTTIRTSYPNWLIHAYPEGLRHARTAIFHGLQGDVLIGTAEAFIEGTYHEPDVKPLDQLPLPRPGRILCEASMVWRWAGLLQEEWYGDTKRTIRILLPDDPSRRAFMLYRPILASGSEDTIRAYLAAHPGRVKLKYALPPDAYHAEQARFQQKNENGEIYALYKTRQGYILTREA